MMAYEDQYDAMAGLDTNYGTTEAYDNAAGSNYSGGYSGNYDDYSASVASVANSIASSLGSSGGGSQWSTLNDYSAPYENASGYMMGGTRNAGVAPGLLDSVYEGLSKGLKWFSSGGDQTKAATVTLAGSFLSGLFSAKSKERALKAQEKVADAAASRAEIDQKRLENASSIKNTNFGAKNPNGLIFQNKLAERQKRAGYPTTA